MIPASRACAPRISSRIPRSAATLCAAVLLASVGGLACGTSPSSPGPATARIYVTNQLDNTASVIDGDTHKIVATVRVGVSPAEMAVSPDRRSVYIANTGSNTVSVLNTDNNTVAKTIALPRGSRPIGVALSPSGRYLYTADGGANRVSVLDTRSKRVVKSVRVGTQPLGVAVAPDGTTVYAANSGSGDVSVIDARTNRVVRAIPTGPFPSGVAVTRDGASVYVTNELSGVTVINAGDGTVQARLRSPSPFSVTMSPKGGRAYVTGLGPGTLTAIDTGTDRVRSIVSVGPYGTDPFTVRATGDALYVANQGASTLSIIDPSTFKTMATVATGNSPYGIAVVQPPPTNGSADVIPAVPPQAAGHVVQAPALPGAQAISSRDRVYTADQVSNTVSVINPKTNEVLGTIPLGHDRLDQILGPVDRTQVNVHGLGFSRDGHLLDAISVTSNAAQLIRTRTNAVSTSYVGRSPHEGFVAPDGRTLWVAVRGQRYVAVLSTRTGREVRRIATADGPSKVVFSPGGRFAYVNHVRAPEVDVVRVRDRRIVKRIHGVAPRSSDEAISPDGRELWLGHPFDGKTTVVDARRMRVLRILNTGPRTNHPNFVSKPDGHAYAYVTVAGLDEVLVFRRNGGHPVLVKRIHTSGEAPHGIWPSPDNTRIYVALQKSDAVDVIDTATDTVIKTLRVGQDPMALVYVANAVPRGDGRRGLSRQGLGRRIETEAVQVRGAIGTAKVTIRSIDAIDELDFAARGLPPGQTFTAYGVRSDGTSSPLTAITAKADGSVDEALAFTDFFGIYDSVYLAPGAATRAATLAGFCVVPAPSERVPKRPRRPITAPALWSRDDPPAVPTTRRKVGA